MRKTFRISTLEGVFAQIYSTFAAIGSSFIVKLLILLNAAPIHFSLLSAIGQVSQLFQTVGVAVTHNLSNRKKACVRITAMGRSLTFFLGAGLLFANPETGIWFTLLLMFCSSALLSIGGNIWIAWISDSVPLQFRGRFFSRRNQYLLIAGLLTGYLGSFAVDLFSPENKGIHKAFIKWTGLSNLFRPEYQGRFLTALFVGATFIGLIGLAILTKQPERRHTPHSEPLGVIYKQPFKDANFRRLLLFGAWWMLAIGIGAAFWTPFMLKKLQMSLFEVQLYGSFSTIASLLSYRFWGRFIDKYGNRTAMTICIIIGGFNPLLWLFMTAQSHYIIWFEALSSGFMWAGAGLVTTNFVLSVSPKGMAQVYSGIFGACNGLAMMLSILLAGFFFPPKLHIGNLSLEPEQVLFGLTGLIRWTALIPLTFIVEAKAKSLRDLSQLLLENILNRLKITK